MLGDEEIGGMNVLIAVVTKACVIGFTVHPGYVGAQLTPLHSFWFSGLPPKNFYKQSIPNILKIGRAHV